MSHLWLSPPLILQSYNSHGKRRDDTCKEVFTGYLLPRLRKFARFQLLGSEVRPIMSLRLRCAKVRTNQRKIPKESEQREPSRAWKLDWIGIRQECIADLDRKDFSKLIINDQETLRSEIFTSHWWQEVIALSLLEVRGTFEISAVQRRSQIKCNSLTVWLLHSFLGLYAVFT